MVVFCPASMLAGLAVKELMVGLATGPVGATAAQPAAEPTSTVNKIAVRTRNILCLFIFTSYLLKFAFV
jgi:hypothetical protein